MPKYNAHQVGILREAMKVIVTFLVGEDISFDYGDPQDVVGIDPTDNNQISDVQFQEILDNHKDVLHLGNNWYQFEGMDTDLYVRLVELRPGKAGLEVVFRDM